MNFPLFDSPPPPLLFVGEVETWWRYRQSLVQRCTDWHATRLELEVVLADEVPRLFPPPASSDLLAASSCWRPTEAGEIQNVVVTVGGVYGGSDGPAGLFEYAAAVLTGSSWLLLDTGHTVEVAVPVLRAALQWLLASYPQAFGHIILCGFSMGAATACQIAAEFGRAIQALLLVSGQSSGTEGIGAFAGKPVLLIAGEADTSVSPLASQDIAEKASAAGANVQLRVFPQERLPFERTQDHSVQEGQSENEKMLVKFRRHHLWDERWEVQELVLAWLRQCFYNL